MRTDVALSRRLLLAGSLAAALTGGSQRLQLIGLGRADRRADPSPRSPAFPVTVAHKYGETVIAGKPDQGVVTAGVTEQDHQSWPWARSQSPSTEWYGGYPSATWPWAPRTSWGMPSRLCSA